MYQELKLERMLVRTRICATQIMVVDSMIVLVSGKSQR